MRSLSTYHSWVRNRLLSALAPLQVISRTCIFHPLIIFSHFLFACRRTNKNCAYYRLSCDTTGAMVPGTGELSVTGRSEEHTSELQSLMRISYAVFCLKKKTTQKIQYT